MKFWQRFPSWIGLLILTFSVSVAYGKEREVIVLQLEHTLAEQVLPTIKALLPDGASVSSYNNQLILKVSPEENESVEQLLRQIDKPARQLLISVRNPQSQGSSQNEISVSGTFAGGRIQTGTSDNPAQVIIRHSSNQSRKQDQQSIRATEGIPAYIAIGESIPVTTYIRSGADNRELATEYKQAERGLYVTARVTGDSVVLDISRVNDRHQQSSIATSQLTTQVRGEIGEWITIGHSDERSSTSQDGLIIRSSDASKGAGAIQLRVEELK